MVQCVLEFRCGWVGVVSVLQAEAQHNTTNVVIKQNSRKLLMIDILMSETCRARMKWNKIASDIKLVFYSSTTKSSVSKCKYFCYMEIWLCVCISAEVKLLFMQCRLPLVGPSTQWLIEFTLFETIFLLPYCMVHAHGLITHQENWSMRSDLTHSSMSRFVVTL